MAQLFLNQNEFPKTWALIHQGIEEGVAPGMVVGAWWDRRPEDTLLLSSGVRRLAQSSEPSLPSLPMKVETIFDLASVTKVMATATLAAVMVDRGWLRWKTPLSELLPDYPFAEGILIEHLLSHTAGLPAWDPLWEKMRSRFEPKNLFEVSVEKRQKAMRELVYAIAPVARPGVQTVYSDISFLLLGFALEELTRKPLDQAVKNWVWNAMGLEGAFFRRVTRDPKRDVNVECAATEKCPWRGAVLQGQVHDDNCWTMGGYGGHAGAFARAEDVLLFSKRLLKGFVSPQVLNEAWAKMSEPWSCDRTRGWDTPSGPDPAARGFPPNSVGHLGFTGTSLWINPDEKLAVTLLTNRVHPTRENPKIKAFRPIFHEVFLSELHSWD